MTVVQIRQIFFTVEVTNDGSQPPFVRQLNHRQQRGQAQNSRHTELSYRTQKMRSKTQKTHIQK
ncbi:MAG: hypothetical protein CBE00_04335 [Planctomycetaceae bacterium TMED240]|nr:hypothetical protein [Rhodopirellula sp.]OUX07627.1 MAG: hypothetical protein CBE00_04335 [Planctomycetaceae bacterium TMED240]